MNSKKFRKFKKNAKALSPVIATIILIAVTVAVSVVVAAWMGGMTIGLMGNTEQASIANAQFTSNTTVILTVINSGANTVTISSATVDGNAATVAAYSPTTSLAFAKGTTSYVVVTLMGASTFQSTAEYTIKLLTARGNTVVYTATYNA
jgi:flagellin-like protein